MDDSQNNQIRSTLITNHSIEAAILMCNIKQIEVKCNLNSNTNTVHIAYNPEWKVTVQWLQNLVTNGRSVNDKTIMAYLEIICNENPGIFYLPSFSSDQWRKEGWQKTKKYFYHLTSKRKKSITCLSLEDPIIIIPLHMELCHWVVIIRRKTEEGISFFYVDDMNNQDTMEKVKAYITCEKLDCEFCLASTKWMNCAFTMYVLHHNECCPRTLLHVTIMAYHPKPYQNMLLPAMHLNLANISRIWVAKTIVTGKFYQNAFQEILDTDQWSHGGWTRMADAQNAPILQSNSKEKDTKKMRMVYTPFKDISNIPNHEMLNDMVVEIINDWATIEAHKILDDINNRIHTNRIKINNSSVQGIMGARMENTGSAENTEEMKTYSGNDKRNK